MAAILSLARSYVVEYAHHVGEGMETDDALRATIRGEMQLPPAAVAEFGKRVAAALKRNRH